MSHHFDVVILGAGPGGGGVASALSKSGETLRIAITEGEGYGGTCPLRGCNPKKVLLGPSEIVAAARHLHGHGLEGEPRVDWAALQRFRASFVDPIPEKARAAYDRMGVTTLQGEGRFVAENAVSIDGEHYTADHFVIATGQRPRRFDVDAVPGGDFAITSDEFLELPELPRRIAFVGGGFIALEFAHTALRAGAEVVILQRSERLLRGFCEDLADLLVQASREAGMEVVLHAPITAIERQGDAFVLHHGEASTLETDLVVNCTGRVPNIEQLDLGAARVEASGKGVAVTAGMQSVSNPRVYAVGDVAATPYALTPAAVLEARVVARNIRTPNSAVADYTGVPSVCYSIPPLSGCGLTPEAASAQNLPHVVKTKELSQWFPWQRLGETHGRAHLVLDEAEEHVLGAHFMGHMAEELINIFAPFIRSRQSLQPLRDAYWAYPTCGYYAQYMLD